MNKLVAVIAILSIAALVLSLCKSKEEGIPDAPSPASAPAQP